MSHTEKASPGLGDDIPCGKCGAALDTGLECTECGYDMHPEIYPESEHLHALPAPEKTQ